MKIKKWIGILTTAALLLLPATPALADDWYGDEAGCYTVQTDDGQALFSYAGQISIDDEYVAADNRVYRVVQVDDNNRTAVARYRLAVRRFTRARPRSRTSAGQSSRTWLRRTSMMSFTKVDGFS